VRNLQVIIFVEHAKKHFINFVVVQSAEWMAVTRFSKIGDILILPSGTILDSSDYMD
jgi:hypothetical protein